MSLPLCKAVSVIESVLRDLADGGEAPGAGGERWEFRYGDMPVWASLDEDWLWLRSPFAGGRFHGTAIPRAAWEILGRNALLPGGGKLAIPPGADHVQASVEVRIEGGGDDGPMDVPGRVRQALGDLHAATARPARPIAKPPPAAESSAPDLEAMCAQAGWGSLRRGDDSLTVRMNCHRCVAHAVLRPHDAYATVGLPTNSAPLSAVSRQAIGAMLLQVGGAMRLVRPGVKSLAPSESIQLDAWLGVAPTPQGLHDALSALSVACDMASREVMLLSNEQIANRYLAARGWSA